MIKCDAAAGAYCSLELFALYYLKSILHITRSIGFKIPLWQMLFENDKYRIRDIILQYMDYNNVWLINRFCQRLAHFKPSRSQGERPQLSVVCLGLIVLKHVHLAPWEVVCGHTVQVLRSQPLLLPLVRTLANPCYSLCHVLSHSHGSSSLHLPSSLALISLATLHDLLVVLFSFSSLVCDYLPSSRSRHTGVSSSVVRSRVV